MSELQLYDSDILLFEEVQYSLEQKFLGKSVSLEEFRQEALSRFRDKGWKVQVLAYTTPTPGLFTFEIEPIERITPLEEFDHERMAHEIQHDLLQLGEGGIIKEDGTIGEASKSIAL